MSYITEDEDKIVAEILKRFDLGVESRKHLVQDTSLNKSFLNGNQQVYTSRANGVVPIENEFNEIRVTDNRMDQFYEWRIANMFNTMPVLTAFGGGAELKDAEAAHVLSTIADFLRFNNGWLTQEKEMAKSVEVSGIAFMAPCWRSHPFASKVFKKKKFSPEPKLEQGGKTFIEETDVSTYDSDIAFDTYTAEQTYTFPTSATKWGDVEVVLTADLVTLPWLQNYLGDKLTEFLDDESNPLEPFDEKRLNFVSLHNSRSMMGGAMNGSMNNSFQDDESNEKYLLLQYRERPSFTHKNGRFIQVIGEHVFHDGEIPFCKSIRTMDVQDSYNIQMGIYPWIQTEEPGSLIPKPVMSKLRPKQVRWNGLKTDEIQNRKALGRNKLIVRDNSMADDAWTDEHGEKIVYSGENAPQIIQAQPLMGLQMELDNLYREMSESAGRPEALQGGAMSQVRSSRHLDILREDASTLMNAHIQMRERFHEMTSRIVFAIVMEKYDIGKLVNIYGSDKIDRVIRFFDSDLIYDIRVKEGSARPRNKAQNEANIMEAVQFGLFRDTNGNVDTHSVLKLLELGTSDASVQHEVSVKQKISNEHAIMRGLMPVEPMETDDHAFELDEHIKYCQTPEFFALSTDIKALHFVHIDLHEEAIVEQQADAQAIQEPQSIEPQLSPQPQGQPVQ